MSFHVRNGGSLNTQSQYESGLRPTARIGLLPTKPPHVEVEGLAQLPCENLDRFSKHLRPTVSSEHKARFLDVYLQPLIQDNASQDHHLDLFCHLLEMRASSTRGAETGVKNSETLKSTGPGPPAYLVDHWGEILNHL